MKTAERYNDSWFTFPKFPIYKNNGKSVLSLSSIQKQAIKDFKAKLASGIYILKDNPCMCGAHDDIVVSEKDRYGIPVRYVLCRNCGLVRQAQRLDDPSTALFYRDDYRSIYVGKETATEDFFTDQVNHGKDFCVVVEKYIDLSNIHKVFEAGCGAGGIIYAFKEHGADVSGCDFGEKYLMYGRSKGLNLYEGEPDLTKTPADSQNLVILSHVLEHLNNPLEYVNNLIEMIAPEGYLLIQVPGLLSIYKQYSNPIGYFQNAHVNNFYGHYLECFFSLLGLEVVHGDEGCTFLLKKPKSWTKRSIEGLTVWDEEMPEWSRIIEHSLRKDYLHSLISPKRNIVRLLELLHLKNFVKRLLGR